MWYNFYEKIKYKSNALLKFVQNHNQVVNGNCHVSHFRNPETEFDDFSCPHPKGQGAGDKHPKETIDADAVSRSINYNHTTKIWK